MASIQEQYDALNEEKQYILENWDTYGEGHVAANKDTVQRINKQLQELSSILKIGPSGTREDIIDVYKQTNQPGLIPDFYSEAEDIDLLRQWETDQGRNISLTPEFKEMKPKGWGGGEQEDVLKDILDNLDPKYEPYRNILQRKLDLAKENKKISFLQGLGQWWREDAPKKLSDFNPFSSAMAGELSSEQMATQRARMRAKEAAKAAAIAGGAAGASTSTVTPKPKIKTTAPGQSGGYQHPTPTPKPTVHSGEASWQPTPSVTPKPPPRDYTKHTAYGLQEGGLVGIDYLTRRL